LLALNNEPYGKKMADDLHKEKLLAAIRTTKFSERFSDSKLFLSSIS